ncbi:MAG: hypothetical protein LBS30_04160 [Planctomycetota bacterium]|jgi:hypothetical protein|nr:hypothetical protein [Planctomycetota bacterium]
MNMLREFFNYFISVMMGRRDSLTAFLEPLTMGERYLRWGLETRDIRDFRSAMDHLHLCHDRDAPMASLLIRKYNCIGDITTAAIETLLMRHNRVIEDSIKAENNYRDELEFVTKKIGEGKEFIRKLQDEGSLIKAKAEMSRLAELEDNARHLREVIASGDSRTEIFDSYDEITSDGMRFFRELDHASAMVMANPILGVSGSESLSGQLRTKLDHLRDRLEKANPVNAERETVAPGAAGAAAAAGKPLPAGAKPAAKPAAAKPGGKAPPPKQQAGAEMAG